MSFPRSCCHQGLQARLGLQSRNNINNNKGFGTKVKRYFLNSSSSKEQSKRPGRGLAASPSTRHQRRTEVSCVRQLFTVASPQQPQIPPDPRWHRRLELKRTVTPACQRGGRRGTGYCCKTNALSQGSLEPLRLIFHHE